jgi:hypothetical protein
VSDDKRRSPRWVWPLVAALLLGFWHRVDHLTRQIPAGDEIHAVRSAVEEGYVTLLTAFTTAATPLLALVYKLIGELKPLDELLLRLPILLFGLLIPWLLPLQLPKIAEDGDRQLRWLYAALLALSPILVFYSRFARPYAPALLFAMLALLAFCRWYLEERPGTPWLYLFCAAFACAWHATTVPAVLAPLVWAFFDRLATRRGQSLPRLFGFGFLAGLLVTLPLALPLFYDWNGLFYRAGQHEAKLITLREILPLLAGSGSWIATGFACLLAILGAAWLARLAPRFACCLGTVVLLASIATWLSGANSLYIPIVFLRYSLIFQPIFLLLVAAGIVLPLRKAPRMLTAAVVTAPFLAYLAGPLPATIGKVNSFSNHTHYQYAYSEKATFSFTRRPLDGSEFYRQLEAKKPGSLTIAEAPYHYQFTYNTFVYAQEKHQQWVKGGMLGELCFLKSAFRRPEGLQKTGFNQLVDISQKDELLRQGVDLVILHHDLWAETDKAPGAGQYAPRPRVTQVSEVDKCVPAYAERLGQPIYQDKWVTVFDVSGRFGGSAAP